MKILQFENKSSTLKYILTLIVMVLGIHNLLAQSKITYLDTYYGKIRESAAVYKKEKTKLNDTIIEKITLLEDNTIVLITKRYKKSGIAYYQKHNYLLGKLGSIKTFENNKEIYYQTFHKNQLLKKEVSIKNGMYNGSYKIYNRKGNVIVKGNYAENKRNGNFIYFNDSGVIIRECNYKNNEILNNDSIKTEEDNNVKDQTSFQKSFDSSKYEKPEFPGGEMAMMKAIYENINYPEFAKAKNIDGKVILKFTIASDGSVTDVHYINKPALGYGLEREAIEVIERLPDFRPARINGIPVSFYFNIPVNYKLY